MQFVDQYREFLSNFADLHTDQGRHRTPERHVSFLREFLNPPEFDFTTFQNEGMDEMIVQVGIPFYSLCEHHVVPFFGTAAVAYVPNERICGLSKLARAVHHFARRLQNQERITAQIADMLVRELSPKGVAVLLSGRHLCMEMRGVKVTNTWSRTEALRGIFKDDARARSEFLALASPDSIQRL
jgi:GTP cyclohydrolase I